MTDKERIFQHIINMTLSPEFKTENSVYWEFVNDNTELKKGDIVAGATNGSHDFSIAFFVEKTSSSELLVQEIGTKRTSNYSNEMFKVLRNFPSVYKLVGDQRIFRQKIGSVINDEYFMLALGETVFEKKTITLTFRKKWSQNRKDFTINYTGSLAKLSKPKIRELLLESGVLEFQKEPVHSLKKQDE